MKKYVLSLFALCLTFGVLAQETEQKPSPWSCNGVVGLNASATGLVNWAAGGNNNVNGVAFGKVRLLYNENNLSWETNLNMEYGLSFIDQKYDPFQKTSDVIDFKTKFGWQFHKAWFLTAAAGFQSQFAYGRAYDGTEAEDPIVSKFLSPSYTDISVGIDWKPNSIFSLYLSPVAGKITTAYVGDAVEKANPGLREQMQEKYGTWAYVKDSDKKEYTNCKAELGLNFKGSINYTYKDLKIIEVRDPKVYYKFVKVIDPKYTGPQPEKFDQKWWRSFNTIAILSQGFNRDFFIDRVTKESETQYKENIESVAEKLFKLRANDKLLKVHFITSDPKLFEMYISDGTESFHCRSIFCAEYSHLVQAHWRFIITKRNK